ncbi:MAG: ThiF family adenylyltransferase [Planctomycetia bacterium]|nr:ThiF family adenylyltransferase [Planctomycetia bacterium]
MVLHSTSHLPARHAATPPTELYAQLTQRNEGFLTPAAQAKVRSSRLLVAGCGLGSVIAELALRTGFERLLVADGDTVATHNLNRQMYTQRDVGRGKAASLRRRLRAIHPDADIQTHCRMLTAASIPGIVAQADVVIDTIDLLDVQAVFALHRETRRQGKVVIAPFTLGWGGAALVFTPNGISIEAMTTHQGALPRTHQELFSALLACFPERIPAYVIEAFRQVMVDLAEGTACSGPQLGVSTFLTAAVTAATAVRVVLGMPVATAPEPIFFDPTVHSGVAAG